MIGLEKTSTRISKPQLKKVSVSMNRSNINHGLMKNVYNSWIKGRRLKCSGYRIQTKAMQIIQTM
jgi:hypothetical protein